MNEMYQTDITVYVSTTQYLITLEKSKIKDANIPILSAVMKMEKLAKKLDKKALKRISRDMAVTVFINPIKRYIFIGKNPRYADTALVEYYIEESQEYADNFFERWEKTQMLVFEFNVYDRKSKYIFTLGGLWDGLTDSWHSLRTEGKRSVVIEQARKHETIISK